MSSTIKADKGTLEGLLHAIRRLLAIKARAYSDVGCIGLIAYLTSL